MWSGGSNVAWNAINCGVQLTSPSSEDIQDIDVEVYNAYLAREDYLIGVGHLTIPPLELGKNTKISVELHEKSNKSRYRGLLTLEARLESGHALMTVANEI